MSRSAVKSRGEKNRAGSVPVPPPPAPSVQNVEAVDIIPGRLTENAWVTMTTQEEGEEVVAEIIAEVMSTVFDKCYEEYLQKQLVPFSASWACSSLVQTVDWLFLIRDECEGPEIAPLWEEDSEAEPLVCDSWAEGCVPVHYSGVCSHTPLLQKLLDLCSAQPQSPTRQELSDRKRQNMSMTSTVWTTEPDLTEKSDLEKSSLLTTSDAPQRRPQPQPSPHKPLPPPRRTHKPLLAAPKNLTQSPVTSEENQVTCLSGPPLHSCRIVPPPKILDPAHLPERHVWPEVEVLEPRSLQQRKRGHPALFQPSQRHSKTGRQAIITPLHQQDLDTTRRMNFSQRQILNADAQQKSLGPGFSPLSTSLDIMEHTPGVSLRDPTVGKTGSEKEDPSWVSQMPELKPMRSSLPSFLWSLDQGV